MVGCYRILRQKREGQPVRVYFDEDADAVYLRLDESPIAESEEVRPGVVLDFNQANDVVGVEILKVKDRVPLASLKQIHFAVS